MVTPKFVSHKARKPLKKDPCAELFYAWLGTGFTKTDNVARQ
jgi:hypothetical protein